jgi:mono/diheme cytochrome c family protein
MAKKSTPTDTSARLGSASGQPAQGGQEFRDTDDYGVNTIHQRIVAREKLEPEEGFEPPPWWVWAVSALFLFVMGFYLGRYSGSWSTIAHEAEQPMVAAVGNATRVVKGDQVYIGVCQTCHQANGMGVAGQYPPLVNSEWLLRDAETPIRIVLYGLEGPITVNGATYNNKMPQFYDKLSNDEIAAVLTHVRSSWGNNTPPVKPEDVEAIRTKVGVRGPWSAPELSSLRVASN